jgi:hypothetical protein
MVGIGAVDSHFLGFSVGLDVPRLIVQSGLDSQSSLVEPPELGLSSVSDLEDHVSVVDKINISL